MRLRCVLAHLLLLVPASALSGCDEEFSFADTPLDITAGRIAYLPGESVTGEVANPDGTITVTLTALRTSPAGVIGGDGERRPHAGDTASCDYDSDEETYECDTTGLTPGPYAVRVTDAAQPGEGTQSVRVAISEVEGFAPTVGTVPRESDTGRTFPREAYVLGTAGQSTPVPVTGWGAERRLTLTVTADGGGKLVTKTLTTDPDGAGTFRIKPLKAAEVYYLAVTDGTWTTRVPMTVAEAVAP